MMTIARIAIAGSDVAIARVGLGCSRIFGGRELRSSARLVEAALQAGITHFDTAPSYGNGTSEAMLGTVLRGVAEATITSKIGIPRGNGQSSTARVAYRSMIRPWLGWFPGVKSSLIRRMPSRPSLGPAADPGRRRISRDELERSLDESLRELRRHRIELYLIHEPDQFELTDELVDAMESFRRDGRIGAFGLAYGRRAGAEPAFGTVLQAFYSGQDSISPMVTPIFHGVLRLPLDPARHRRPVDLLREVVATEQRAAFVASASSRRHIAEIGRAAQALA